MFRRPRSNAFVMDLPSQTIKKDFEKDQTELIACSTAITCKLVPPPLFCAHKTLWLFHDGRTMPKQKPQFNSDSAKLNWFGILIKNKVQVLSLSSESRQSAGKGFACIDFPPLMPLHFSSLHCKCTSSMKSGMSERSMKESPGHNQRYARRDFSSLEFLPMREFSLFFFAPCPASNKQLLKLRKNDLA